ncbi:MULTISPECIES: hypothetical protein [Xanthomonas]|uniref:hypothetical protein n=1 Tax=Xanthomonas TaxID=338 RepID=UPI0015D62B65|nr:hypothetical protein [Xanthomonas hortorum]MEB1611152.1 hypothetical protein [Xanthomonas campestris pv. campestris]MCE4358713.1 hypothetical protein [Xanthomonas hortorum pv. taraxaci]NMI50698.1 hypothetical protein [Xanthomonas hortorum pv. taraxaci]CAD0348294.1 hypothetical protein NCPPB940_33670 [Xanthomonas hortorum pv. taraxaci]CAD0348301.1 hypothetical protein NCPPB940_33670 [Xanthomonas hortorum pv. taraxaci]
MFFMPSIPTRSSERQDAEDKKAIRALKANKALRLSGGMMYLEAGEVEEQMRKLREDMLRNMKK